MVELGELEEHHADFSSRGVRVLAVSLESREDAAKTKKQFPHLLVAGDKGHDLIATAQVLHPDAVTPEGQETAAPTTVLIDRQGIVRWIFRPRRYVSRLKPRDLLKAVDQHLQ